MIKKTHSRLWLVFAVIVFTSVAVAFFLVIAFLFLLYKLNLITVDPHIIHFPILALLLESALIGGVISFFVGKLIIRPIDRFSAAFTELSGGNFDVRVSTNSKIDEIRKMEKHFNSMVYDLSHIETLRNDFVVNVSHEFKTPLSAIEGYATLLQEPGLSREKHNRYVDKILENSRRLTNLSSNILLLSRLENQETVLNQKEYRLDEQLRKIVLLLENKWTSKNLEFDIELPRFVYYGSEQLMDHVWYNILDNAIKHSPQGGTIHISLESGREAVSVSVSDEGDGMAEEVQKHIFEKFYQGDPSRKAEGNGLGLALVVRILDLCGGTVSVTSAPGAGAAFTVQLQNQTRN